LILFLDIEHPKALEDAIYRAERTQTMEERRSRFEALSGEGCSVRHYSHFRNDDLLRPDVTALITSGNRSLWEGYDLESDFRQLKQAIQETRKPVLGICGGHQLIGLLLGGRAEPLGPLAEGEPDVHPEYAPGLLKEWGYCQVEFAPGDPLFAGFGRPLVVKQMHFWHLTSLPDCLVSIAQNQNCPVQALRHRERPVYGVQFHPEFYDENHRDGQELLKSFFLWGGRSEPARA
jgi:GMP synthase (glutamine-hydrolysing)